MPPLLWQCPTCGYAARSAMPPSAVNIDGRPIVDGCSVCFFRLLGELLEGKVPQMQPVNFVGATQGAGT